MTCSHFMALLDGFIDGEIETAISDEMQQHLRKCDDCSNEYASALRLKKTLADMTFPDPGNEYWQETTDIIMARTVGADLAQPNGAETVSDKRAFVRSMLSLAASLLILFTAMLLGTGQNGPSVLLNPPSAAVEHPSSIDQDSVPMQPRVFAPTDDQTRLLRGTLLLASPGAPGLATAMARMGVGANPISDKK